MTMLLLMVHKSAIEIDVVAGFSAIIGGLGGCRNYASGGEGVNQNNKDNTVIGR